jgi:hypothetical protein
MILHIKSHMTNFKHSIPATYEGIKSLFSMFPFIEEIVAHHHNLQEALNEIVDYLSSHHMEAWLSQELIKKNKNNEDLEKTRGTLTFPKVLPKDTRPEENVKQIPKDEKAHPMHGGLYEVKPAQEQFLHTMVQGIPAEEQYRAITSIKNQIQQGTMGIYHPKQEKAFALDSDYYVKAHEAIHAMVDKVAKHLKAPSTDEVYHRMNTLIHQDDVPVLKHMLMTFGYPVSSHHRELIPFIHSILHDREMRNHYIEHLKLYRNNFDIEKRRKDIQRLGRTWNAILQTGKRVSQLSDLPKEG